MVINEMRKRKPLQASATSSAREDIWITLPSRTTGTPTRVRSELPRRDATNWSGREISLKMIAGKGIIKKRTAQGNKSTRKQPQPQNGTTRPANTISSDTRDKKLSAPSTPNARIPRPAIVTRSPDQLGADRRLRSWSLRFQITQTQKIGTRKPCEQLGSSDHCLAILASTGM